MNHPTREEWISYVYEEVSAGERATLAAHLRNCPGCAARVDEWQSAAQALNTWELPAQRRRRVARPVPAWQWAAAAAMVLVAGFSFGRAASAAKARADIEPEIRRQVGAARAELRHEFAQMLQLETDRAASATLVAAGEQARNLFVDFSRAFETGRVEDQQSIYAAFTRMERQRAADYVSLKKDLDTLAVNADAGLRQTEQQLIQLADYTQPLNVSNPIHK